MRSFPVIFHNPPIVYRKLQYTKATQRVPAKAEGFQPVTGTIKLKKGQVEKDFGYFQVTGFEMNERSYKKGSASNRAPLFLVLAKDGAGLRGETTISIPIKLTSLESSDYSLNLNAIDSNSTHSSLYTDSNGSSIKLSVEFTNN